MREWFERYWRDVALVALLVALAIYYSRAIWSTQYLVGADYFGHLYRARFLADAWRQGIAYPLWDSTWYAGYPFLQLFAPLPYFFIAPIIFFFHNDALAVKIFIVAIFAFSVLSMYWASRIIFMDRLVSVFSAFIFLVLPFRASNALIVGNLPALLGISIAPLMIAGFYKALKTRTYGWVCTAGILSALLLLSQLYTFYLVVLLIAFMIIWLLLFARQGRRFIEDLFRYVETGLCIVLVFFLACAAWLIPFIALSRGTFLEQYSEVAVHSLQFGSLSNLFRFGLEGSWQYVGAALIVVVFLSVFVNNIKEKRLVLFFSFMTIASIVVVVLDDPRLLSFLPMSGLLQASRFFYLVAIILPFAAGPAIGAIVRNLTAPIKATRVRVVVVLLMGFIICFGLWLDLGRNQAIFGRSSSIAAETSAYIKKAKTLPDNSRVVDLYHSLYNHGIHPYVPALTGQDTLGGWYIEGAIIRKDISLLYWLLEKEKRPDRIAPLLALLNTEYVLVEHDSRYEKRLLATKRFVSIWQIKNLRLLRLIDRSAPAQEKTPILLIGDYPADEYLLSTQLLGEGNYVFSSAKWNQLDRYSEVQQFAPYGAIVLYNYNYLSTQPDSEPFASFVRQGGTLYICPDNSPDAQAKKTTQLFGVNIKVASENSKMDWEPQNGLVRTGLPKDVVFKDFSPAIWENKSWSFSEFDGVEPLLEANGHVVIGRKRVGKGQVVFIGFNFLYHVAYYKNAAEARLLSYIFSESLPKNINLESAAMTKNKTGVITVVAKTATRKPAWLMISQSYFPGWQATVNGKQATIQTMRPPMMLVRVSGATNYTITLKYLPTTSHYAGMAISAFGIPMLAGLALFPRNRKRLFRYLATKMQAT